MSTIIALERDGHDQPWGFRLQGGVDVGLPLSILRIIVGSPAESVLRKGDVVTKISQTGTHNLTHQQAVDLFNNAGNQISVTVKRPGAGGVVAGSVQPSVSTLQASASIRQQQQQQQQPQSPPIVQSANLSQSPQVAALPRTTFVLKSDLPPTQQEPSSLNSDDFSVQNQPYRTLPLVQPSVKVLGEIGAGSYSHLRLQEDICTGIREPQLVPVSSTQANAIKANELIMKQKVNDTLQTVATQQTQQGLVNAATDHQKSSTAKSPGPVPGPAKGPIAGPVSVKLPPNPSLPPQAASSPARAPTSPQPAKYNTASGLYANQSSGVLAKKGGTGMINPVNQPPKHLPFFALAKKYDPEQSATWQAIHEQENCQLITEHGPTESKVYSI